MNNYHCGVCGTDMGEVEDVAGCPNCNTVYNFRLREVDRSHTQVAPMDCKHRRMRLVSGASGMGQNHHVSVCFDCGEMHVSGYTANMGDSFDVRIVLWSQDIVDALAKPAALVAKDEARHAMRQPAPATSEDGAL